MGRARAGLDNDAPAILVDGSLKVFKYLRLGLGKGWFRVNELIGAAVGQPVPTGTTVRVRQKFGDRKYVSLTFALDSLVAAVVATRPLAG